jgi:hypothetical protein
MAVEHRRDFRRVVPNHVRARIEKVDGMVRSRQVVEIGGRRLNGEGQLGRAVMIPNFTEHCGGGCRSGGARLGTERWPAVPPRSQGTRPFKATCARTNPNARQTLCEAIR